MACLQVSAGLLGCSPKLAQPGRLQLVPVLALPARIGLLARLDCSSSYRAHRRNSRRSAVATDAAAEVATAEVDWIPVCLPEELPKGVRKEVDVNGVQVLLFWYRNQIYCIEARSPAEGAYSEGFIKAKFTQDYSIECPSTGSQFSIKDGSVQTWYPNNPVLRALTPKDLCRPLQIYPVKLAQEAIYVDVGRAAFARNATNRGGAGTSIENNNVFTVQPTVYFEGMDPAEEQASLYMEATKTSGKLDPVVAIATTAGVGAFAVAGTAVCIYLENLPLLGVFWAVLGSAAAYTAYNYISRTSLAGK
ncbi:rieske [2Fe-2S] protein [Haematococcus lacustris]|uniref:Rieske [2Fe-2S] protein n=1 Tax=Haematococcus lacustris TaxID=44745 RepID=A0A699ZZH9_HAELA|nr:hypothetical protein QJQ45_022531 [Haematococcus lacustris]GFH27635.1 rieske [2Fe-2S] protein [Haematococcus lacustris]